MTTSRSQSEPRLPDDRGTHVLRFAFFFSVLLHGVALTFFLRARLVPAPEAEPVVVELSDAVAAEPAPRPKPPRPPPRARARAGGPRALAGPRADGWGPSLRDLGITGARVGDVETESGAGGGDGAVGDGELLGKMRDTVAVDRLWERIDAALIYPKEFHDAGVEGEVRAVLQFDGGGRFVRKESFFETSSPFLRVLVLRTLRRALDQPLKTRAGLKVRCLFEFELVRKEHAGASSGALADHLGFYRAAKLFGEWKLGPFSGYGIAPAVGVDPSWVLSQFKSGPAPEDPLRRWRVDPEFHQ